LKKHPEEYETLEISHNDNLTVNFLYNSFMGRIILKLLVKPILSKFAGLIMDCRFTRIFIRNFIKRNNINIEEYQNEKYKSFNDFFSRKIKYELRPFPDNEYDVCSPCDSKLTAYPITQDGVFNIKNSMYTIEELLQDKKLADEFINGICMIFRLTTDDYHRYIYIDNGKSLIRKKINGVLHTVRPISQSKFKVFIQNTREYEVIQTEQFGKIIQMEVGALFVGRIKNHETKQTLKRGEEKGMFEFGGSTIIILFQNDMITLSKAIYDNTHNNKETIVKMGQKIGEKR